MSTWFSILTRRKPIPSSNGSTTQQDSNQLARVLTTLDLTALGVGSTLGVGVYVLAGHVAKETAGPAVILSFLIAAIASVFAGLCYAEFGARVPKAGSAYIYSYVCVGEFIAFIIGWNLILEYVIGSASVAKGLSVYLDTILNNTMKNAFIEIAPIQSSFLSDYFDFFSLTITLVLGGALAFGLKESSLANNIFTLINILVVIFVVIAGGMKADPKNWSIKNETIPPEYNGGNGGFFPFGIEGVIKGAATCFYGFVGFDCIATTGEEVKNPQRAIPISIILSLFIIFLSYFGTSAVVTLMLPYYLQDPDAPIPHAFAEIGWEWAKWIVSIGGIFGLCASLFGAMFPLPRIIYAMANDALVFRFLGTINSRFHTPVIGTIFAAILTGIMSALFNLKQLVNMMSIGTLMAYTIVAACVIILRYSDVGHTYEPTEEYSENLNLISPNTDITMKSVMKSMFNFSRRNPTNLTQKLVTCLVFIFCILSFILACLVSFLHNDLETGELYVVIPTAVTVFLMLAVLLAMYAQPTVNATLSFKVPLVPLIPALSICINIYLMMMLDGNTWIRFGIWMAIGLPIYLISCKLYSAEKTKNTISKNGVKQNGRTLTIPQIIVDPPSIVSNKMEDILESETDEQNSNRHRDSIDSNDLHNAVLELDKVLDLEPDSYEAINPENDYKNTAILSRNLDNSSIGSVHQTDPADNQSISSSNSGSVHSKEYHIEVLIHQEDTHDPNGFEVMNKPKSKTQNDDNVDEITTNNDDKINNNIDETGSDITNEYLDQIVTNNNDKLHKDIDQNLENSVDQNIDGIMTNNDGNIHKNMEETKVEVIINTDDNLQKRIDQTLENSVDEIMTNNDGKIDKTFNETGTEYMDININEITTNDDDKSLTVNNQNVESSVDQNLHKNGSKIDQNNKATGNYIPPPPPLQNLLDETKNPGIILPVLPFKGTPFVTTQEIGQIELKPISKLTKERSSSTSSEGPLDNVTPGTVQYNKIKNKLDVLFKNRLPLPDNKFVVDEKIPSPTIEKQLKINNGVLEHDNELPDNFGKSKEFKNTLNDLLFRTHSTNQSSKPQMYKEKYENNEIEHKTLITEPIGKESEKNDKDDETRTLDHRMIRPSTEKDQERHTRLMIATLREIKLRKTGLSLNDDIIKSKEDIDR